jgi:hypothetical protein
MRRLKVITAMLGLGLGFAAAAPAAHASSFNLIPEKEGEVKLTNFGLEATDENYIGAIDSGNLIDLGFSVTSLDYTDNGVNTGLSRLFIDKKGTANQYGGNNGKPLIKFATTDEGTTEELGEYYLRAVATDSSGNPLEDNGKLEVGLFKFDFEKSVDLLTLNLFDTETSGVTGIETVNGKTWDEYVKTVTTTTSDQYLKEGEKGNLQTLTLENVTSFTLKLGEKFSDKKGAQPKGKKGWKGDGVTVAGFTSTTKFAKAVPEPTTTFSLGALAVAGMFGVKKRKNLKK